MYSLNLQTQSALRLGQCAQLVFRCLVLGVDVSENGSDSKNLPLSMLALSRAGINNAINNA